VAIDGDRRITEHGPYGDPCPTSGDPIHEEAS
jgi:hypothetical protein